MRTLSHTHTLSLFLSQTSSFETTDYPTQPSLTTISSPHSLPPSSSSSSPHTTSSIIKSPHSHHHPSPSTDSRGRGRGERSGAGTGTLVEVLKYGEEDMAAVIEQTRQEERAKVSWWQPAQYDESLSLSISYSLSV